MSERPSPMQAGGAMKEIGAFIKGKQEASVRKPEKPEARASKPDQKALREQDQQQILAIRQQLEQLKAAEKAGKLQAQLEPAIAEGNIGEVKRLGKKMLEESESGLRPVDEIQVVAQWEGMLRDEMRAKNPQAEPEEIAKYVETQMAKLGRIYVAEHHGSALTRTLSQLLDKDLREKLPEYEEKFQTNHETEEAWVAKEKRRIERLKEGVSRTFVTETVSQADGSTYEKYDLEPVDVSNAQDLLGVVKEAAFRSVFHDQEPTGEQMVEFYESTPYGQSLALLERAVLGPRAEGITILYTDRQYRAIEGELVLTQPARLAVALESLKFVVDCGREKTAEIKMECKSNNQTSPIEGETGETANWVSLYPNGEVTLHKAFSQEEKLGANKLAEDWPAIGRIARVASLAVQDEDINSQTMTQVNSLIRRLQIRG